MATSSRRVVTVGDDFRLPQRILDTLTLPSAAGTEFVKATPASEWSFTHGLGRKPMVTVYLSTGEEVEADVVSDATHIVVTFPTPVAGSVVLI